MSMRCHFCENGNLIFGAVLKIKLKKIITIHHKSMKNRKFSCFHKVFFSSAFFIVTSQSFFQLLNFCYVDTLLAMTYT